MPYRCKEDGIQHEGLRGDPGDAEVAAVGWVEGASEQSYTHGRYAITTL
jgi:hypothetical protein